MMKLCLFASGDPGTRLAAAEIATECAPDDPRTLPALLDRLSSDPDPMVRKLIASRMLVVMTGRPGVIAALQAAAAGNDDTGVRWAAGYALCLAAGNSRS